MMRLILRKVTRGARLGLLTELQGGTAELTIETPMCMVYTRGGRRQGNIFTLLLLHPWLVPSSRAAARRYS